MIPREVPGNKGYKYFGAARDLPGVRELFESDAPAVIKKTRAELMKVIRMMVMKPEGDQDDGLRAGGGDYHDPLGWFFELDFLIVVLNNDNETH